MADSPRLPEAPERVWLFRLAAFALILGAAPFACLT